MTDLAPLRKALILCTAVAVTAGLTACDNRTLTQSLARIKEVPVDARGAPADGADAKSISREDVQLVVNTAKDLAVGKGGLLRNGDGPIANPKFKIAIVDPLSLPPGGDSQPLDTGVQGDLTARPVAPEARATQVSSPQALSPQTLPSQALKDTRAKPAQAIAANEQMQNANASGRLIQIGSFGTADAARDAWQGLQARYPGVEQYKPTYQKITTAAGKPMVRLKLGPVAGEDQAKSLCRQLDIRDNWCAKAG
ncbi:SPOR domain-containing protein [Asticcacaulis sp. 201]|uniref:SPOR domain-containing protein n=1 Tax=Asticcacaulis sp. 201 TaxID=3028787 RepID=UPI002915CC9C|nr:SPOR domain-containing protein [Asticcacaulis sp. 201]MDV6333175.1 SPOR domain-containing protein [Asticcacaulis sp. 201]